jgi:hypothetical protein
MAYQKNHDHFVLSPRHQDDRYGLVFLEVFHDHFVLSGSVLCGLRPGPNGFPRSVCIENSDHFVLKTTITLYGKPLYMPIAFR